MKLALKKHTETQKLKIFFFDENICNSIKSLAV